MPFTFAERHIGTTADAQARMLDALGYDSIDALVTAAVPESIHVRPVANSVIPAAATERESLAELRSLANRNLVRRSMIGLGYYDTITPAVIKRNVLENPSWYTAYTPYQPEISQGRLEALINFQTMVADLTGLTTANASMLDEGTAVVEGMLLARRGSGSASNVFIVDADTLPQTKALLANRADAVGIQLAEIDLAGLGSVDELPDAFAVARPVRSATIVWKLMRASSRPCEISGWYGVYAVYQEGFSSTFRWMTAGVMVPE